MNEMSKQSGTCNACHRPLVEDMDANQGYLNRTSSLSKGMDGQKQQLQYAQSMTHDQMRMIDQQEYHINGSNTQCNLNIESAEGLTSAKD